MLSCSGMYQNQPFLFAVWMHERRALVAAGVAIGAFPVGPDRALVQHRDPRRAGCSRFMHQPVLAAGIDDDLRAHLAERAVLVLDRDADGAVALEEHVEHAHAFVDVDAVLAGVVEHHLVELAAHHLPGLRALVRLVVPEVERRRQLAVRVDELHAVLLDEVALLHLRQHVEPLQHPVGLRDQRLADVEARKVLALEQLARGSPAGRAAWRRSSRRDRRR